MHQRPVGRSAREKKEGRRKGETKLDKACSVGWRASDRCRGTWMADIAGYDGGIDEKKLRKDDGKDGD